jgi:hypothetical protein
VSKIIAGKSHAAFIIIVKTVTACESAGNFSCHNLFILVE